MQFVHVGLVLDPFQLHHAEVTLQIEIPLAITLKEMEETGVALDLEALAGLSRRLERMVTRSEEDIYCIAGVTFNINSAQQLSEVLFKRLRLPPRRRCLRSRG